jgi:T5SS/PEP-CTERM-associated repeat protein
MSVRNRGRRALGLACAGIVSWPVAVYAAPFVWSNGAGTNVFNTAGNWTPAGGPPNDTADRATFDGTQAGSSTFTVTFTGSLTNDLLEMTAPSGVVTFDLKGFTYTLERFGSGMEVGNAAGDNAGLVLTSTTGIGTVRLVDPSVVDLEVGNAAGATGALTVGANVRVEFDRILAGTSGGTGRVDIINGAVVAPIDASAGDTFIGLSGGTGTLNVSGAGTQFEHDDLVVGSGSGKGTVTFSSGASIIGGTFGARIGSADGNGPAQGTLTVTGAGTTWDVGGIDVGQSGGTGSLSISGGAAVTASSLDVALQAPLPAVTENSTGTVTVSGSSTKLTLTFGMKLGNPGTGIVTISSGAEVNTDTGGSSNQGTSIGAVAGSTGSVTLSGTGTKWNSGRHVYVGGTSTGAGGSGTLTIGSNTALTIARDDAQVLKIWGPGTLNLNGGTIVTPDFEVAGGTFNWTSGTLDVRDAMTLGLGATGSGLVLSSGKTLRVANALTIAAGVPLALDGGQLAIGSLSNSGIIQVRAGALNQLIPSITNEAPGLFLVSGATLSSPSDLVNHGELRLEGGLSQITAPSLTSDGLVAGDGRINAPLNNLANGEVRLAAGQRLAFQGTTHANSGVVHVQDATADFIGALTNTGQVDVIGGFLKVTGAMTNAASGLAGGRNAVLRFDGGLSNSGRLGLSFGVSDVFGSINNAATGRIIVSGASQATFYGPITHEGSLVVSTGSTAVFFAPVNGPGTVAGDGTIHFEMGRSSLGPLDGGGAVGVKPLAVVIADRFRQASLNVEGVAQVRPDGTDQGTSRVGSLTIAGGPDAWTGSLDLSNNDLVLQPTAATASSVLAAAVDQVRHARNGGRWDRPGLTSSSAARDPARITTLAVVGNRAEDGSALMSKFSGQAVDENSVLVKYTYYGDANLDGRVSLLDYFLVDLGRARRSADWGAGDFDFSGGPAGPDDYLLMDRAFLGQGRALGLAAPLGAAAVPEPAGAVLLGAAGMLALRRRRA